MIVSRLKVYYSRHDKVIDSIFIANVTRIWIYAVKINLSVCFSKWQTNSTDIQVSVVKVLSLLQSIESFAQLRSFFWPICVTGYLALKSQKEDFRRIVGIMSQLSEFDTIFNALRIMKAVWSSRVTVDDNICEIDSCLGILGSPALLF